MRRVLPALAVVAMLAAGCGGTDSPEKTGGGGGASARPTMTDTIRISNYLYQPESATVRVGQKVSIVNSDDTPHTLTDKAERRTFDSGTVKGGARGSVTFRKSGTYSYFCEFHATMRGSVTVAK